MASDKNCIEVVALGEPQRLRRARRSVLVPYYPIWIMPAWGSAAYDGIVLQFSVYCCIFH